MDVQTAGAGRAKQTLVPCEREQAHAGLLDVDGDGPGRLRRIHQIRHLARPRQRRQRRDWHDSPDDIGAMRRHEQPRRGTHRAIDGTRIERALGSTGHDCQFNAERLKMTQRSHHRVVFDAGRHHVIAGPEQAVQRDIERVGGVVREDEATRIAHVEQPGERLACIFDNTAGRQRHPMTGPAGIASRLRHVLADRSRHGRRLRP